MPSAELLAEWNKRERALQARGCAAIHVSSGGVSPAQKIPLEALQRREGQVVAYRLKKDVPKDKLDAAKEGLNGRSKFVWLSEHWQDYFEPIAVQAGVATLERVEVKAGLADGDQVSLEDPTRKKVEKDDENN